ncbi:C2H2 transcription factor [Stagonosporopsis vannaccii]|nr:C2H2 transcription factor [Stagonosporopsis vannaccii]
MAHRPRKQTNILLAFKVLHLVSQLRRRVKPRVRRGFDDDPQLGNALPVDRKAMRRFGEGLSRLGSRGAKQPQHIANRVCKCRKNGQKLFRPVLRLHAPGADGSECSNRSGEEVQHMLSSVDSLLGPTEKALSAIASDNKLFFRQSNSPMFEGRSLDDIVQLLVATHEAIQTLSHCRSRFSDNWLALQGQHLGLDIDETFVANYEHLLLRLQTELVRTLQRKVLDETLHPKGGHDKKQRKLLSWFNEFAEKPRPLSTSFPWTIKSSLAVLWGVCWMFYNSSGNRVPGSRVLQHVDVPWTAPGSSEYVDFGLQLIGSEPQPEVQQQTGDNVPVGPASDASDAVRNADTWPPDWHHLESRHPSLTEAHSAPIGALAPAAPPQFPGQSTYDRAAAPQQYPIYPVNNYLPQNQGAAPITAFTQLSPDGLDQNSWQLPYSSLPQFRPRHLINRTQTPSIRVTGTAGTGSEVFAPPQSEFAAWPNYISYASGPPHHSNNTNFDFFNMGNNQPLVTRSIQLPQIIHKHERSHSINSSNSDMPTPVSMATLPSPVGEQQQRPTVMSSPRIHTRQLSEDISSQDEHDGSLRKNHSYKRAEEPPRNQEAKMICKHQECSGLTFDRKCEWSKHMDKHDRPYKCLVKGCEKLQGFTYSGGLLRHEREVHKMHGGTKKSLFCPFTDCKRSSGAGFTRKENLAEHIRRVHRRTSMSADMHGLVIRRDTMERSPTVESRQASESPYVRTMEYQEADEPSLKRKRVTDSVLSDRADEELRAEIKRLRHENEEKDARLRQLEQAVMALQQSRR